MSSHWGEHLSQAGVELKRKAEDDRQSADLLMLMCVMSANDQERG